MALKLIILVVLAANFLQVANTQQLKRNRAKSILDKILSSPYDTNIRPSGINSSATDVQVNLLVNSFSKIDDFNMEYKVQLTLRMDWYDDRLNYSSLDKDSSIKYLTLSDMSRVWTPDLFFINEKEAKYHSLLKPNVYVRIFRSGEVQVSVRISLTLSCPMKLHLFPMDTQKCAIIMASYAWTTDDVNFHWRPDAPVQLPNLTLPRFSLEYYQTSQCDRSTLTGIYSCIRVDFVLTRNFSFYLTQVYLPCVMLVIVSWVNFWIDENAVPARTALGITTLLTMATQQANMNKDLPPVSYIKALDIWSVTCVIFIFGALLEYAFVNYSLRFDKRQRRIKETRGIPLGPEPVRGEFMRWKIWRNTSTSKKIDLMSRIIFPVLFLIFNIVYWYIF